MKIPIKQIVIDKTKKEPCKGLFFRCRIEQYIDNSGQIVFKTVYYPLKRMSCKGCEQCGFLIDDTKEFIADKMLDSGTCKDGKIYELQVTNIHKDWETGYCDDYEIGFVEVKDENSKTL